MGKRKKYRRRRFTPKNTQDFHHFLFQRRHWQQGYAKALRNHWYCGAYIPRDTLHRGLHSKIHDIPVPNGKVCKRVYEKLCRMERNGLIDLHDSPVERLNFLINEFKEECPATTAMLEWQRDVISKFYNKG